MVLLEVAPHAFEHPTQGGGADGAGFRSMPGQHQVRTRESNAMVPKPTRIVRNTLHDLDYRHVLVDNLFGGPACPEHKQQFYNKGIC